jgi:hypothetical protein
LWLPVVWFINVKSWKTKQNAILLPISLGRLL